MPTLAPTAAPTKLAIVVVRVDPDRQRLLVRFEPGHVYGGLQQIIEDFRLEFRGHGELTWRRTTRVWSMPATPSVVQRVQHWCDLMATVLEIDWQLPLPPGGV